MATSESPAESIFFTALEKGSPEERARYLTQACGGDTELRDRVERMLNVHPRMGSFLESAAAPATAAAELNPALDLSILRMPPGTMIGRYKLLEPIGEGGYGVVFMAEQTSPVQRKVALKIIKAGMDTRQVIARFEAERQALALMDHPNIAKVFDAGTTDSGRLYFVMELVKGVSITKYCDAHHVEPRQRLELFMQVCQAVQHAHQKGIIHRDIKPNNVLVAQYDGKPVPKVIDFGVAKATGQQLTERTMFTGFGDVIGTLEYMSPEQAEVNQLDVDTRSDIYSLGVLLYELLTGSTPLEHKRVMKTGLLEMLRVVREEEPPRPSTRLSTSEQLPSIAACRGLEPKKLSGLVHGELDWIVMKALEKDRTRRYETANGLAADVQRYLSDEAVAACPPSARYRFRKFARQHKAALVTVSLVVAALAVGTAVATWQAVVATRANRAAFAAAAAEKNAKDTAEAREAETAAVLDFVENRVFAAARPDGQAGGQGREVTLRKAVEAALPFVQASFTTEPLIEARLRMTLGASFGYLGEDAIAGDQFQKALALYTRHRGPDHLDTLNSMYYLAISYNALGRLTEALKLREETLALRKAKLGPDHPDTLKSMHSLAISYRSLGRHAEALKLDEETLALRKAKLGPDHPDTLKSMNSLANSYDLLGRDDEALKLREETLALWKAKLGPDHPETLMSMSNLAASYYALGRHADALQLRQETLALRKAKLGADHPDTLESMNGLANSYRALGRDDEALKLREETLALRKAKLGPDHPDTLMSMSNLAVSYRTLGRDDDALKLDEETLAVRKAKLGRDHPETLTSMNGLAVSYRAVGRHAEALKLSEETLALRKAKLGADHPDTLDSMSSLASSYRAVGRYADALQLRQETLALRKAKLGADHPDTLGSMNSLANSYEDLGRHDEALKLHEETLVLRKSKLGPDHPNTLSSMTNLAISYNAVGRHAEAVKLCEDALALQKAKLGPDHPDTLNSMQWLADSYSALGRHAEAVKLCEDALALQKSKLGPDHPDTLGSMMRLANSYADLGRDDEALKLREETLARMKAKLGPDHPETLSSMNNLANSYEDVGRHDEAIKLHEQTLALRKAKLGPNHPDTLTSMTNLAISYNAVGRHAEALKLCEDALAIQKATLGADHPDTLRSMEGVAESLVGLDRGAEALLMIDECIRRAPGKDVPSHLIPHVMWLRLLVFEKSRDAAGCLETAGMWEALKRTDAESLYQCAYFRAVCAVLIKETDKTAASESKVKEQAERATAWLKQAVAAGYKSAEHTDEDKHPLEDEELRRFDREAKDLLKITDEKPTTEPAVELK